MYISQVITEVSNLKDYAPESPEGRTGRFDFFIGELLLKTPGNIVEIGAGEGHSTKVFLEHAKRYDRKVLVIDPWQTIDQPPGYGVYSYDNFKERTKGFDNLVVAKIPSFYKEVNEYLRNIKPIAFAFVDGLQFKEHVLSDLFLIAAHDAQVICVDDINRSTAVSEVPEAVEKFLQGNNKYTRVETNQNLIECYLIRN